MKKLLCILLALLMMCSSALADSIVFKTPITSGADHSASVLMELCEQTTTSLCFDVLFANQDIFSDFNLAEPSYVGILDNELHVYIQGKKSDYWIGYIPGSSEAELGFLSQLSQESIEFMMQLLCPDGYVQNDIETLKDTVREALDSLK